MAVTSIDAGRYQPVNVANRLPGCCGLCTADKGPFIDTGRQFKMHGSLFICFVCLTEMARVAGLFEALRPEPVDPVVNLTYEEFKETVDGLAGDLSERLTDLLNYLYGSSVVPLLSDADESVGESEDDGGITDGSESETNGSDLEDFDLISVEGPDDLSDDSGDGESEDSSSVRL